MNLFGHQLFSALVLGAVYALVAMSMTLIYSTSKQIQLAHGDVMIVGGYVGYLVASVVHNIVLAVVVAGVACGVLGLVLNEAVFRWLRGAGHLYLVAGLALSAILEEALRLVFFQGRPITYPASVGGNSDGVGIALAILAAAIVVGAGFQVFSTRGTWGRALRATADNPEAARLLGVPVERMIRVSYAIGSATVGMAGVMLALVYQYVTPFLGIEVGLVAIAVVLFGGLGNVLGALVGSLLVAVAEVMTTTYVSSSYKDVVAFALIIVVIRFRPQGLFGRKANLRA